MFRKLLVANRGEIALRVLRTCRSLGIRTVAVHSEADRDGPWLDAADEIVCVGSARADASYLNQDSILQVALQSDCQAVHPGYGFLAENAAFAARCVGLGLVFVGPPASAIRRMGDKLEAKRAMAGAGLPTIPGTLSALRDLDHARQAAEVIGYPVLLKAAAGGGGKGMRRCADVAALVRGFPEAVREAQSAFGDGAVYLEKFLDGGRHIEFQVLVDTWGKAVHLGERECTIQRAHQKLVEESPSCVVGEQQREVLGRRVARAVAGLGYRNAGTVEFLRDSDGSFHFMEVNARLQVEHPVTEMRVGVDLVEWQLRIAAGEPLCLDQDEIRFSGHAIEFRVNAEDPDDGFRPDPGLVTEFEAPPSRIDGASVRWDSAVRAGWRIPPHYDSMIGKLIVHAADRPKALEASRKALEHTRIIGMATTIGFHLRLLGNEEFRTGHYDLSLVTRGGF